MWGIDYPWIQEYAWQKCGIRKIDRLVSMVFNISAARYCRPLRYITSILAVVMDQVKETGKVKENNARNE
jgi:hypothetical protein